MKFQDAEFEFINGYYFDEGRNNRITQVIQHSSNIGIGKVALKLGAKKVLRYLRDLGFGRYFYQLLTHSGTPK